jgi:hypothetical protein
VLSKTVFAVFLFFWSTVSWAQATPTVVKWIEIFQEVRQHQMFNGLNIRYSKAAAKNVGYTPIGVVLNEGSDCSVVIAEGENPKMRAIMRFASNAQDLKTLMLVAAAHELGHCLRVWQRHMSPQLWLLMAATDEGSPERHSLQKIASFEEAYADAFAFAYVQDAHPEQFPRAFGMMRALRSAPEFETELYQVEPLYNLLVARGLDARRSPQARVDDVMKDANF